MAETKGWSKRQVVLHWTVVVLVVIQLLLGKTMEEAWEARQEGEALAGVPFGALAHVVLGASVLLIMLYRLYLRRRHGHPPRPERQPPWASTAGAVTHWILYALLILMPLAGATAWFLGMEAAAELHSGPLRLALIAVVLLHAAGALTEHFVFRSPVLKRMLGMRVE